MRKSRDLAVVYLARKAEGPEPPTRFLASYRMHEPGEPHELVVLFKGFEAGDPELVALHRTFGEAIDRSIEIDNSGIDITAYLRAAGILEHRELCFLNTFSEIETDGWLGMLARHLRRDGVGVVGATGSYESLRSSMHLLSKVVWLCAAKNIPFDGALARSYNWFLKSQYGPWLVPTMLERMRSRLSRCRSYEHFDQDYEAYWESVTRAEGPVGWAKDFPNFPNPHIRSNCFMIERERLLDFGFPPIMEKMESCAFESGHRSMTMLARRNGQAALVVGKDGRGYDVDLWPESRTFRLADQANVIVADNQVRTFDRLSPRERAVHVAMTWGEYAPLRPFVPNLGVEFKKAATPL